MKLKFLVPIFLLVNSMFIFAQYDNKKTYSENELKTFLKIYEYSLDHPFDISNSMKLCVNHLNIPQDKMTEIFQAQFSKRNIKLTSAEEKQMKDLQLLMSKDKEKYDAKMNLFIESNNMHPSIYTEIEKKYNSDLTFQNEVNKLISKK